MNDFIRAALIVYLLLSYPLYILSVKMVLKVSKTKYEWASVLIAYGLILAPVGLPFVFVTCGVAYVINCIMPVSDWIFREN